MSEGNSLTIIEWLEAKLHPWSTFIIVPTFAFANTGVHISSESISGALHSPIAWGIFCGLVVGKPLGIIIAVFAAKRANIGDYPNGSSRTGLLATGSAAGIGFTVAIFIAKLAFTDAAIQDLAVTAVIVGSIISALISVLLFRFQTKTY